MSTEVQSLKFSTHGAPALVLIDVFESIMAHVYQAVLVWPFPHGDEEEVVKIAHWDINPNSSVSSETIVEVLRRKAVFYVEKSLGGVAAPSLTLEPEQLDAHRFQIDRTAGAYASLDVLGSKHHWIAHGVRAALQALPNPIYFVDHRNR